MVPYADLILPDTTYLERWDCISLLDRPISEPDGPADAIRQPVVEPDRDVRAFQDVLIDLGARLKLPGFVKDDGTPKFPGGYPDYIVNHERRPGIGPLAGFRGRNGGEFGRGEVNPRQLEQYIADGCFHIHHLPEHMRYFKHVNKDYIEWALDKGMRLTPTPVIFQLYSEPMQKFRLAARGHGAVVPPEAHRGRIETYFDPLPFWYPPFEGAALDETEFPMHAITQRPMAMYHSWGSQNAWLRQIHGANRLYMNRAARAQPRHRRRRLGLDRQPDRPGEGAGEADGRRQCRHGVDLERHRQARRRLGACGRRAGSDARLPAQPPDRRAAAGAARRLPLLQQRSRHRPGRLVRPQGAHREGCRGEATRPRRASSRS